MGKRYSTALIRVHAPPPPYQPGLGARKEILWDSALWQPRFKLFPARAGYQGSPPFLPEAPPAVPGSIPGSGPARAHFLEGACGGLSRQTLPLELKNIKTQRPPPPSGGCPRTSPLSRILGRSVKVSKAKRAVRTPDRRLSEEYIGQIIIIRAIV